MIKSIWLFYVFKFSPRFIDESSPKFWNRQVKMLNNQRKKVDDSFKFWELGRLSIRDPHAHPNKSEWLSSKKHPFCWDVRKSI